MHLIAPLVALVVALRRRLLDQLFLALLAGVAYAGAAGVGAVELRADGGPWRGAGQAEINAPPLPPMAWAEWRDGLRQHRGQHMSGPSLGYLYGAFSPWAQALLRWPVRWKGRAPAPTG